MRWNQLIIIFLSVLSLVAASGCTSSQTEGDPSTAEVTDESLEMAEAIDNNDDLAMDFDGGDDAFADLGEAPAAEDTEFSEFSDFSSDSELALSDETAPTTFDEPTVGEGDLSEVPIAEAPMEEAPLEDLASDFGAPLEDPLAEDLSVADNADPFAEATPDVGAPIESAEPDFGESNFGESTPEPTFSEPDTFASSEIDTGVGSETSTYIPLKKMIAVPYMHAGKSVNALYMAREGDTLQSISQKIFGGDRVSELCAINAYNCSRDLKVGDKYYYNSPQRPNDSETVRTFYEDAGVPAQTYITQEGDNIRNLGETLLGNRRSWMELWATNQDIESKGELVAGTVLRYWPSSPVAVPTLAQNEEPLPPVATEPEPMPEPPVMDDMAALNDIPEVPEVPEVSDQMEMDDFAQNNADMNAMGSIEPPPPPPPPPAPPMDPTPSESMDMAQNSGQFEDPNQTMALGVGAILLLAGVLLFIAIRKRRARRPVDFNTSTQTQIE